MSYIVPGTLFWTVNPNFPLPGPGSGYDFVDAKFEQAWFDFPGGDIEWAQMHWFTPTTMGIDFSEFTTFIARSFANLSQGGTPLAWRLYHKTVFDIQTPSEVCAPEWLPLIGGGCIPVPDIMANQTLLSCEEYVLQVLYAGSPAAIALTGSLTLILLIAGIFAIIVLMSTGVIHLDPGIKQAIESNTPAGIVGSLGSIMIFGILVIGAVALLQPGARFPSFQGNVRGPGGVGIGGGVGSAGGSTPPRAPPSTASRGNRSRYE